MKGVLLFAAALSLDSPLVERPGPGQAPTAFRIWAAGENDSDDGPVFFTRESAEKLMTEQSARGRIYSSDFDHLSLVTNRPAESGRASGWHRLEVRDDANGEPELWAVDIEWCADVKAGLEESPPKWRFYSPAFARNKKTSEVTSYVNFALCINPLTHDLPSLAAATPTPTKEEKMKLSKEQCAAHLAKMAAADCTEEERKDAMMALAEYFGEPEGEGEKKPEAEGKAAPGEPGAGVDATQRAAGEGDPPKKEKGEEETEETKAAAAMASRISVLESKNEVLEIRGMLRDRAELPESVRKWLATQSLTTVRSYLSAAPRSSVARPTTPTQGDDSGAPQGLQGPEKEELDRLMGIRAPLTKQFERLSTGELVTHNIGPTRAREIEQLAAKAAGGGAQ